MNNLQSEGKYNFRPTFCKNISTSAIWPIVNNYLLGFSIKKENITTIRKQCNQTKFVLYFRTLDILDS